MIELKFTFPDALSMLEALRTMANFDYTGAQSPGGYSDDYDSVKTAKDDPNAEAPDTTEETAEKAKRKRRTKAEIAADEAAEAAKASAGEPGLGSAEIAGITVGEEVLSPVPDASDDPKAVDFESARAEWETDAFPAYQGKYPSAEPDAGTFMRVLLQKVVDKIGMDAAREFMVVFGYGRVSEIPADRRDAFYAAVVSEISA